MNHSLLATTLVPSSTSVQYHDEEIYPPGLEWVIMLLMVVLSLLGLTGNGLVCYFFIKKKTQLSSFNMLLLNLSIADLLVDVFAYPVFFVDLKMLRVCSQSTANILCSFTFSPSTAGIAMGVSILTISYISLNRFVIVKYPMKAAWIKSRKLTCCALLVIWLVSIGFLVPTYSSMRYDAHDAVCYREWPEYVNVTVVGVINMVLGLIAPVAVMLLTFFTMHKLKTMTVASPQQETLNKKKRAVRLLGFLILAFCICWVPSLIYLLLSFRFKSIWPKDPKGQYVRMRVSKPIYLLTLTNAVADPLLYNYYNDELQKFFKDVFVGLRSKLGMGNTFAQNGTAPTLELEEGQVGRQGAQLIPNTS